MDNATIDATAQLMIRYSDNHSIPRRLKTNDRMMRYNRVTSYVFINTLFSDKRSKSKSQFTCAQLFVI